MKAGYDLGNSHREFYGNHAVGQGICTDGNVTPRPKRELKEDSCVRRAECETSLTD